MENWQLCQKANCGGWDVKRARTSGSNYYKEEKPSNNCELPKTHDAVIFNTVAKTLSDKADTDWYFLCTKFKYVLLDNLYSFNCNYKYLLSHFALNLGDQEIEQFEFIKRKADWARCGGGKWKKRGRRGYGETHYHCLAACHPPLRSTSFGHVCRHFLPLSRHFNERRNLAFL